MEEIWDMNRDEFDDPITAIDRYKQKFYKAIEKERERLREEARLEADSIIADAREKAAQMIEEAQERGERKTEGESDGVIAEAEDKAKQVVEEAQNRAQEESDRYTAAAKQKAELLTVELIETAKNGAEEESAAILNEAKEKAKREAEKKRKKPQVSSNHGEKKRGRAPQRTERSRRPHSAASRARGSRARAID